MDPKEKMAAAQLLPTPAVTAEPRALTATEIAMVSAKMRGLMAKAIVAAKDRWRKEGAHCGEEKIWDDEQPPAVPAKEKCPWLFPWPEPPGWNG